MSVGLTYAALGSTANQILASNLKNNSTPLNNQLNLSLDCITTQLQKVIQCGSDKVVIVKINNYGLGGFTFDIHRCYNMLKTRIEEALMKLEENASRNSFTLRILYATIFPGGTSSSSAPILMDAASRFGLKTLSMYIIPDDNSQMFQLVNTINSLSMLSNYPVIVANESFSEMIPEETRNKAELASNGNATNFIKMGQFSYDFGYIISQVLTGTNNQLTVADDKSDDFDFLEVDNTAFRNQNIELESSIGGKKGLFSLHYARSKNTNFEELSILRPSISPEDPQDPNLFIRYDSSAISEDDVINDVMTSMDRQYLKCERLFCIPSSVNEVYAVIPTNIPYRIKTLINQIKKDKPLNEVFEKWAKRTIISGITPIRTSSTKKIIKSRMAEIFFQDKSEWKDYWKKQDHCVNLKELPKKNLAYFLGEEHGVYLKPLGYRDE